LYVVAIGRRKRSQGIITGGKRKNAGISAARGGVDQLDGLNSGHVVKRDALDLTRYRVL
jgi:hypothetical protein